MLFQLHKFKTKAFEVPPGIAPILMFFNYSLSFLFIIALIASCISPSPETNINLIPNNNASYYNN